MPERERKVAFEDETEVIQTLSRHDFTADELSFMHYSSVDLEEMKEREIRLSLELSMKDRRSSDDDYSTGLETPKTDAMRERQAETAVQIVLEEQERELIDSGIREDEYIAKVYKNSTRKNKVMARHRGFDNAIQVKSIRYEGPLLNPLNYRSSTITDHSPHRRNFCSIETDFESSSANVHFSQHHHLPPTVFATWNMGTIRSHQRVIKDCFLIF